MDGDLAMISLTERTRGALEEFAIDAPNGRRNISRNEAHDIVYFLGRSAASIVDEAKKAKE